MISNNEYFESHYSDLTTSWLGNYVNDYFHKKMESSLPLDNYSKVLELGSLHGYHKRFVKHSYEIYYETDILTKNKQTIGKDYIKMNQDAENLKDFKDNSVDRIIATCLLAHLKNPEKTLQEIKRVIKKDGTVTLWVANDPSILLRVIQVLFRKPAFKKKGLDYDALQYRQHINYFTQINFLINYEFKDFTIIKKSLPFKKFWYHFNLVTIYQIST